MSDPFAAALPELRDFSEASMPDTFTVDVVGAFTPNGQGGGSYAPGTTRGPYNCRLATGLNEEEQALADRMEQRDAQRVSFPLSVTLGGSDKGTATNHATAETFRFSVLAIIRPGSYPAHRKALIRRIS
jgi:hypothetical protein